MSCKIRWKHKKNVFKFLSILLVAAIIIGFHIGINIKTQAAEPTEPSFSISDLSHTPENPKVGEDITVTGKIIPNDFVTSVPENDIVLVLDVSGSMERDYPYRNHHVVGAVKEVDYGFYSDYKYYYYCYDCKKEVDRNHQNEYVKNDKLKELKKATNNFIDKMKSVPNVKIGIVAYSTEAWINPVKFTGNESVANYRSINEKNYSLIDSSSDSELKDIVNCLKAVGGTNTGEGMRKGLGLLEKGSKDARKTVILMSDGEPTYYSYYVNRFSHRGDNYYVSDDLNEKFLNSYIESVEIRGTGYNDEDGKSIGYALEIGKIIKEKSYNAFTIGYGLDNSGNEKMKKIQNSMTGKDLTNDEKSNEENGFFATSSGAIDSVFNVIGDKILNEYQINKVQLNLNMPEDFTLNIGGNVVNLSNIKYKLKEDRGDKLLYSAEPVPFSFRIKCGRAGEYKDIFNGSKVSFQWNENDIYCELGKININVLNNGTPIINATLDPNTTSFTGSGPFNVNYKINPEQFKLDNDSNSNLLYDETAVKNVAILVDESIPKEQVFNSIVNNILSDQYFAQKDTRYSLITYGKDGYKYYKLDDYFNTDSEIKNAYNNMGNDRVTNNEKYSSAMKALVNIASNNLGKESSDSSIKGALDKAIDLLEGGRKEIFTEKIDKDRNDTLSNKNIVIIGKSNISDIGIIDKLNSDYKVITFNYGKINANTKDCDNNIRSLHYKLTGKEMKNSILDKKVDFYYLNMDYSKYISNNYNDRNDNSFFVDSNNIGGINGEQTNNIQNSIMGNIAENLKDNNTNILQVVDSYEFKVKLKFQVGLDIEASNLNNSDSPYDKESKEIVVRYTLDRSDGYYKAPEQTVSFSIKPKINSSIGNKSKLTFGKMNSLIYKGIGNEDMISHIETPIINMYKPKHGIYLKGENGGIYHITQEKHTFLKNSFGTFAAEIKYAQNGDNIKLTLPPGVELVNGAPEIWKVDNGKLSKTSCVLIGDGKFYYGSINNVFTENNDNNVALVIYTVKMPESEIEELENTISVNNGPDVYAKYQVGGELPDLF